GLWLGDKWLAFVWKVAGFIFTVCSSLSVSLGMDFCWGNMACWCKVLCKIKCEGHATSMKEGMEIKHALNARLDIKHTKTALRKDPSLPFESCCLPVADKGSSRSSNFLVKPLLSNSSLGQSQSQDVAWTYFAVEVPSSVAMKINVYAKGGTWCFGIKRLTSMHTSQSQTTMSILVKRYPRKWSSHGTCQTVVDMSGLSIYSYCWCDRNDAATNTL
nr:hypothetical protein [Tanacetum cinerariifolium]